ncbi:MAG: S8 family serine peptidase [Bacteroidota bacterium]|nr:S8 family serine peptidase [Bacteroidota bacterium]
MNITRGLFLLFFYLILSNSSFGYVKISNIKKTLPLDGLPGVVSKTRDNSHYLQGRVIVRLNTSVTLGKTRNAFGISSIDNFLQKYSIQSVDKLFQDFLVDSEGRRVEMSKFYVIHYTSPIDAFGVAEEISQLPEVLYAEPWFVYYTNDVTLCSPNDPHFTTQWGLKKILADSAWCISQGDTSVVIGIIDTGVQWDHLDLNANIWINHKEYGGGKESNGIDDDNNGKIDDWHGWDFGGANLNNPIGDNDPSPKPSAGDRAKHGTHVAGIASAVTDNSIGVAGIGYKCKILPVKVSLDDDLNQGIYYGFHGILYSVLMGAKIINCSWGGEGGSQFEQEIIDTAVARGALVVAAAGNTGKNLLHYPSSYRGVLSVASTASNDAKSNFSSYNSEVDVCAPGENIRSTYFPSTYDYLSGTSMSTPFVAGLAALVKSHIPDHTPIQAGEQVRATCDDINSINPSHAFLLGKGRINAYKAITTSTPSLRMISLSISDSIGGNNNKIPQPNETISLTVFIKNFLIPTSSSATITLSATNDPYVEMLTSSYPIGVVNMQETRSNASAPFSVKIKSNIPPSYRVQFTLTITDVATSYSDFQLFSILVNPTYATHTVNNVEVTLTNIGRIGFLDLSNNHGSGFVYGGGNQLFEGGLLAGYSSSKSISVVRNDSCSQCQNDDFTSTGMYNIISPGIISNEDGNTKFSDASAPFVNRIGLSISMSSHAFTTPTDSNYVILRYEIQNVSGNTISNFYAGLFFDWDILGDQANYYLYNKTSFDSTRNLGYAWNVGMPNSVYCGASVLEGPAKYHALINNSSIVLSRDAKWSWLSGNVVTTDSIQDIHFVVSSGPHTILNGDKRTIGFTIIGGKNLADLQKSSDSALVKWDYIKMATILPPTRPRVSIPIHQNPVFSRYADLYATSYDSLAATPLMLLSVDSLHQDTIALEKINSNIFKGKYEFSSSGAVGISLYAVGMNGLDTTVTRELNVQLVKPGVSSEVYSLDGNASIQIPPDAIQEETYFTIIPDQSFEKNISNISYSFGPARNFDEPLTLTFKYNTSSLHEGKYPCIYKMVGNRWTPIESWINPQLKIIQASVNSLGTYALGIDDNKLTKLIPEEYALEPNYPNPFNPETKIRFSLPNPGVVRLTIYNTLGQEVRSLLNTAYSMGYHEVVWDGRNNTYHDAASGIYFYRMSVVDQITARQFFNSTRKMILLR